jgi:hypothetical protein
VWSFHVNRTHVLMTCVELDPTRYSEADRREVDPARSRWRRPPGLKLASLIGESKNVSSSSGRVRGADGRQRWTRLTVWVAVSGTVQCDHASLQTGTKRRWNFSHVEERLKRLEDAILPVAQAVLPTGCLSDV